MRERAAIFADWTFGAAVPERLVVGPHCVDYERYWRVDPETPSAPRRRLGAVYDGGRPDRPGSVLGTEGEARENGDVHRTLTAQRKRRRRTVGSVCDESTSRR